MGAMIALPFVQFCSTFLSSIGKFCFIIHTSTSRLPYLNLCKHKYTTGIATLINSSKFQLLTSPFLFRLFYRYMTHEEKIEVVNGTTLVVNIVLDRNATGE